MNKKEHLQEYLNIIDDFLAQRINTEELGRIYQTYFVNDPISFGWQSKEYGVINEFFLDCEDYVEDPNLRRPQDYDEAELRRRAMRARGEILALMEGGGGNGAAR